ncbi:PH domain-containing protein [Cellulomonas sp. ES6]|uniref:PH domain-containing protein n=1 Tax=Cellulomonas sp. ES6 TaxID=3039384 RepID=UPI0024B7EAAE|nr:PH domain-containing protein [Cellulomonas sp. ES6]WHP19109.1 PH domain-containing protein [Cellulomonas sp. ES6]
MLVAVLAVIVWNSADDVRELAEWLGARAWLFLAAGVVLVGLVGFGYSAIAWRMTRFAVTDDAVHLRSGVLFRQQRQARLDRLQAVDVVQPLLARILGLSELRLEVAGGAGSAVSLAFLREAEAEQLRAELLARAAGLHRPAGCRPWPCPRTSTSRPPSPRGPTGPARPRAPASRAAPTAPARRRPERPLPARPAPGPPGGPDRRRSPRSARSTRSRSGGCSGPPCCRPRPSG